MPSSAKANDVTVIIVTWNSERFIENCIGSVFDQTYPSIEAIVVDNASQDSTLQKVRQKYPSVVIVENSENLGYCRANNLALQRAQGEYLLFLNSDVVLERGFIRQAMKGFEKDERIGMVSGKMLRFDRRTIDSTGQFLARSRKTIERGYGMRDDGQYESECRVFSVCGAAAFYRRAMIDDISYPDGELFDEDFFAFHEDIDVGWRANAHGWKGYYVPEAVAYHYRGGTGENSSGRRYFQISRRPTLLQYHIIKNRYLSIIKNDTLKDYCRDLPFILSRDFVLIGYCCVTSPGVIYLLLKNSELFWRALHKRRYSHASKSFSGRDT